MNGKELTVEALGTKETITWCPGCTNFSILRAVKNAVANLVNSGKIDLKNVVAVSGVGCHDKIYDYLNFNGFHSIHGRTLPTILGIKIGNPELTVIGFGGDGATYAEGISHLVHAYRYNVDATFLVHNNQLFALTTGQATPASPKGFIGPSTPLGVAEKPLNPIALALISGATFVARGFALDLKHLTKLVEAAIVHKGFGFIDVLQPCIAYQNTIPYLKEHLYKLEETDHSADNAEEALKKSLEWDYCTSEDAKIPIGVFYKENRPTYEEQWPQLKKPWYTVEREVNWKEIINQFK